ncbi:MAG: c-type cytochrome [Pseudomonadota bacterium]
MKLKFMTAFALSVAFAASAPVAMADEALAKQSGCLTCHSVAKKMVGPSFQEIAAKYKGDAAAKDTLIASIKGGSKGKWGNVMMPANSPRVSDENIAKLAAYILAQ